MGPAPALSDCHVLLVGGYLEQVTKPAPHSSEDRALVSAVFD